jgi:hypothetical protein
MEERVERRDPQPMNQLSHAKIYAIPTNVSSLSQMKAANYPSWLLKKKNDGFIFKHKYSLQCDWFNIRIINEPPTYYPS